MNQPMFWLLVDLWYQELSILVPHLCCSMPEVRQKLCDHNAEDDDIIHLHILVRHADTRLAVQLLHAE